MQAIFDTHTHSCYSVDSDESLENIYRAACDRSMLAVAVTDHYDIDMMYSGCDEPALVSGYPAVSKMRDETADNNTKLLCGIELGAAIFDTKTAEKIVSEHDYDVVISSLHGIMGKPEYYQLDYANMTDSELYDTLAEYFTALENQAKHGSFDILAHLDYPTRYVRRARRNVSLCAYSDMIDGILRTLAENGKALEINSSGLRDSFNATLPQFDVIKRFRELGGEFVSFGSDAHTADLIGYGFKDVAFLAKRAGFDRLTYFEKRRPISVKIEI